MKKFTIALFVLVVSGFGSSVFACGDYDDMYLGYSEFNTSEQTSKQDVQQKAQQDDENNDSLITASVDQD